MKVVDGRDKPGHDDVVEARLDGCVGALSLDRLKYLLHCNINYGTLPSHGAAIMQGR